MGLTARMAEQVQRVRVAQIARTGRTLPPGIRGLLAKRVRMAQRGGQGWLVQQEPMVRTQMAWMVRLASAEPMVGREEEAEAGERLAMVLMGSPVAMAATVAQVLMAKLVALGALAAGARTVRLAPRAEPVLKAVREAMAQTGVTDRMDPAALMVPTERGARMVLRVSQVPMEWLVRTERAVPMVAAEPTARPVVMGEPAWRSASMRSCSTPGISTGETGARVLTAALVAQLGMAESAEPVVVGDRVERGLKVPGEAMVPVVRRVVTAALAPKAAEEGQAARAAKVAKVAKAVMEA